MMLETITILGVRVSRVNLQRAYDQVSEWVAQKHKTYVCVAPVSTLVDAQRDKEYARVVNAAGMLTPDGMPVVWLARSKGCADIERTYGPDLMHQICDAGREQGLRHFFFGGADATLVKLRRRLESLYPGIQIAGTWAPPYRPQPGVENAEILRMLNESKADVLWIGLGSPKQDFWMDLNRPHLDAPVIIGAGAAFDFLAGVKPQAPVWMRRSGLEWLFRLSSEPRRLWRRYLIGNSLFLRYLVQDFFGSKANSTVLPKTAGRS